MIELPVLKRGLEILQHATRNRKEELQTRIQQKKPITEEEEIWLDGKGNNVDGEALIGLLESARDYATTFTALDESQQAVAQRLRDAGTVKPPGNKCKHM
ncbi:hypothetical protein BDN71DRAFT_1508271 [Pleurotus eryngii]|uniref:Uncharacterized protein n=1 Tax=Pleurotus eryngii TaxID=5323 RepID=A0A9P6D771_PLEER|nr:hypothetical protein BDN71DRAFT_1508271 [Pleurotus eryngii]